MESFHISSPVDAFALFRTLAEKYFDPVERIIRTRLSTVFYTIIENEGTEEAKKIIDGFLRNNVHDLQRIIPGAEIFWDNQVDAGGAYKTYPRVIVDVVDGARNLMEGGTDVTSTLCMKDDRGNIPLAVISYPFGVERIVDFNGDVYRIPNDLLQNRDGLARAQLKDHKMNPRGEKTSITDIHFMERYDNFDDGDATRIRIDAVRDRVRSYMREAGSIVRMMMKVILESCDVFLTERDRPINFHDFLAPAKIINDLQGHITDIRGNEIPMDAAQVNGLIVSSRKRTYDTFMEAFAASPSAGQCRGDGEGV